MLPRNGLAVAVMMGLVLASFAQAAIMCAEVGLSNGWLLVRNDPGKFIFHLLLLPMSYGMLIWSFPTALLRECWKSRQRVVVALVGAVLVALPIWVGIQEAQDGFEQRFPVPTDVGAGRQVVLAAWRELHEPAWMPAPSASAASAPYAAQRSECYEETLDAILGSPRDFWTQASVGGWWSAGLSILGISLGGAWLFTILVVALQFARLDERTGAALVVAFCTALAAIAVWDYFKAYSEWYINFYAIPEPSKGPLIMATLAALLLAVAATFVKAARNPLTWFAGVAAVSGFATAAAKAWKPELLSSVATAYHRANDASISGLWTIAIVAGFIVAYLIAEAADTLPLPPAEGSSTHR